MVFSAPPLERYVLSEFSNRAILISSEAWRHECEVAFFLGLPESKREEMLEGSADGCDPGVRQIRGEPAVAMLRKEMGLLAKIRRAGGSYRG